MSNKNIWYLPGPFHQYQEDVKALAKANGLRIIDASATESREDEAENTPTVTMRDLVPSISVLVVGEDQSQVEELLGRLQAESNSLRVLIAAAEGLVPLEHPEAGELPIRLFDALLSIHNSVVEVTTERDGLRTTVDALRDEVEALKKAAIPPTADEAGEIAALKAKLDEAKVPYRANASKDSLEKLVADLPKT
ncbi:hypothetical protein PSFL_23900 [Pseudomonas sp. DD1]|uniref:hypothetical protein n=1 Tax=unclassified Pseudomonas TaxID=196821 RepID=UPI0014759F5A|nr:hypothetical protein [Pseudomonas sp. WS 5412]NMY32915.1 hypothetical protein [Pseudomonas sp. WS 5412]